MNTQKFRAVVRKLRKHFPVTQPVKVVRRRVKGDCGLTTFDGRTYHIRIKSNQDANGQFDTLLHEWAHVCAIEKAYLHDEIWGAIYAKIYDAWDKGFE